MLTADRGTERDPVTQTLYSPVNPPSDASRLRLAFAENCTSASPEALEALRRSTISFVEHLKHTGASPEQVLIKLKESLAGVTRPNFHPSLDRDDASIDVRENGGYRLVLTCFLDTYFGPK